MQNLGMRHVALNVKNVEASKTFYSELFGMQLEWQPDAKDAFLTTNGQDNLALHQRDELNAIPGNNAQFLDHIGFVMKTKACVDEMYEKAKAMNVKIVQGLKQHRDGAYSFYCADPDGVVVQVIYHSPISDRS